MSTTSDIPLMSVTVGGRLFKPALAKPAKVTPPSPMEVQFNNALEAYTSENVAIEPQEGIKRRERALVAIGNVCRDWIRWVCIQKGLPPAVVDAAGGKLFVSGSYRLGVHEPGADIDTILVAPSACHRTDFFGTTNTVEGEEFERDPNCLAERFRRHKDVTNFNPVETAAIPLLTFDWEGINIDLLFARLNSNSVPLDLDIDSDAVLDGVDGATEKSLNGPRVTNLIAAFVNGTEERYQNFLAVVRCVRKWAKARGLYNNKMGYWGGVNINIAVAVVVQLYPNACPATLLRMFFLVFKTWKWPRPVMLTEPHDAGFGLPVWTPQNAARQIAPMITPAYPGMNSTLAISRQTLRIMQEEFERGHAVVDEIWKQFQMNPSAAIDWSVLFEPSDFFISYPNYLSLCIVGPSQADAQAWSGFVESRLRKLVSDILCRNLPIRKIQLWPKKIEACVADKAVLLTQAQRQNSMTYFIGYQVDKDRMRGEQLLVEISMQNFRDWELGRFHPFIPGMDLIAKPFKVKELPTICFHDMYSGGKWEAMKKRRSIKDKDPARLARKAEELRAQIERKKEERQNKKRKLEEAEEAAAATAAAAAAEKTLEEKEADQPGETEETNLLEDALETNDTMTREEAEAAKKNLLTGELFRDEEAVDSDDEVGYTGDGARQMVYKRARKDIRFKNKRCLPPTEENADLIRKLGYSIVTDDESKVIGTNVVPPWKSTSDAENDPTAMQGPKKITFLKPFDIVELDSHGHVIDKGDEDFMPSRGWIGRKAGFEFKLGERGLGYYRTGKKVEVPSNTAY